MRRRRTSPTFKDSCYLSFHELCAVLVLISNWFPTLREERRVVQTVSRHHHDPDLSFLRTDTGCCVPMKIAVTVDWATSVSKCTFSRVIHPLGVQEKRVPTTSDVSKLQREQDRLYPLVHGDWLLKSVLFSDWMSKTGHREADGPVLRVLLPKPIP